MPASDSVSGNGCPPWCAGHDDEQEPTPTRWHRSEGVIVPVVERRQARLAGGELAPLTGVDFVVALEQDARATYVYLGPLEDGSRFLALTADNTHRLCIAINDLLAQSA